VSTIIHTVALKYRSPFGPRNGPVCDDDVRYVNATKKSCEDHCSSDCLPHEGGIRLKSETSRPKDTVLPPSRCRSEDVEMSKTKNGLGTGGKPRRDVLASLKMASMEDVSRAALPAGEF